MIFYRLYTNDWLADTAHLSLLQRGALSSMTIWYLAHERPLPREVNAIHRIVGALHPDEQQAVADVLQSYFALTDEGWRSAKLDADIVEAHEAMKMSKEAGLRGAKKRWSSKRNGDPNGGAIDVPNGGDTGGGSEQGSGDTYAYSQSQSQSESTKEPPPTPQGGDGLEGFTEFWRVYPIKKSKKKASEAWVKLSPTPALIDTILLAVQHQAASEQWRKDGGKYVPYPVTWLNNRRWEDEPQKPAAPTAIALMTGSTSRQSVPEVIDV